jgi:hypothetical protein
MKKIIISILAIFSCVMTFAQKNPAFTKDQFCDDANKEWCYLKRSATVIGVPFQRKITLVTYDGSLSTGNAELSFFYGKDMKPVLARQKNWLDGWIPIVEYSWNDSTGINYQMEMFAFPLEGQPQTESVNFVKITVFNPSNVSNTAFITAATRGMLDDYRSDFGNCKKQFSANRVMSMEENNVAIDGEMVYTFPTEPWRKYAIDGEEYTKPFFMKDKGIDVQTPCGSVEYRTVLAPHASKSFIFKMSLIPTDQKSSLAMAMKSADYEEYKAKTIDFWKKEICSNATFSIPEKRINDGYKASLVHVMLATRTFDDDTKSQTDGVPYQAFFLTSAPQMELAYLGMGRNDMAKMIIERAVKQQEPDGLYFDRSLAHGGTIPAAHGHILYALGCYWFYTHDRAFLTKNFPSIEKAVDYIRTSIEKDSCGLLPPTYQYDNEMIDGHYASNNFWALTGLRFAIRMAKDLHHDSIAESWTSLEETYHANILKGIEAMVGKDGYVRTGLFSFKTGKATKRGFPEFRSDCDWENMLLVYPTEILPKDHPYVTGTLRHIRKGYGEGIMTYRHGLHLHQYITANMIEQYMARGESEQALTDFYHLALHCGSTYEGFENMVWPWQDREVASFCIPPHAWASAKLAVLTRNFLLCEMGGKGGMEKGRDLYLMSVLSEDWLKNGDSIVVKNAPTEMGVISAKLSSYEDGATIRYKADYSNAPDKIKFRIPYFKKLKSFESDDTHAYIEDGCIVLSPSFTRLDLKWEDKNDKFKDNYAKLLEGYRDCNVFVGLKGEDEWPEFKIGKQFLLKGEKDGRHDILNFDTVRKAFLYEMDRRHVSHEIPDFTKYPEVL